MNQPLAFGGADVWLEDVIFVFVIANGEMCSCESYDIVPLTNLGKNHEQHHLPLSCQPPKKNTVFSCKELVGI